MARLRQPTTTTIDKFRLSRAVFEFCDTLLLKLIELPYD
jgi:hypothetical protein